MYVVIYVVIIFEIENIVNWIKSYVGILCFFY